MKHAIFLIFVSLLTCSCLDLYGAWLAPTPKISFVSVAVVPKPEVERRPVPYFKVSFTSDIDLQDMTDSRHLFTVARAYRCKSDLDSPPPQDNPDHTIYRGPYFLAYDYMVRDQNDLAIDSYSNPKSSNATEYHAYIDVAWPWYPPALYDLRQNPDNICVRVEAGTGLELGNLISYTISTNTLFIPADRVRRAIAEFR